MKRITTAEFSPNGIEFRIKSAAESVEVGKIIRVWTGRWSAHHLYKIIFPRDLAAEMKVALLAAWYMIVGMFVVLNWRCNYLFIGRNIPAVSGEGAPTTPIPTSLRQSSQD